MDVDQNELDRVLVQSSLSTIAATEAERDAQRHMRQTVDERDAFLAGLDRILKFTDQQETKLGLMPKGS